MAAACTIFSTWRKQKQADCALWYACRSCRRDVLLLSLGCFGHKKDITEASERSMGDQAAKEILQQYSGLVLPDGHPTTKYVRKVADRILAASGLDTETHGGNALKDTSDAWGSSDKKRGINWKVRVIKDDKTKNAFVLPNGDIFVFVSE